MVEVGFRFFSQYTLYNDNDFLNSGNCLQKVNTDIIENVIFSRIYRWPDPLRRRLQCSLGQCHSKHRHKPRTRIPQPIPLCLGLSEWIYCMYIMIHILYIQAFDHVYHIFTMRIEQVEDYYIEHWHCHIHNHLISLRTMVITNNLI